MIENKLNLISVIIPIYNAEEYIHKCIKSIINQSLVNDGSTDTSGVICDNWAKKDPRIYVIHQENCGVTVARKTGVEHSSSEWVCFVDADDFLPENALERLFSSVNENIDMVYGSVKCIGNKQSKYKYFGEKTKIQYIKLLLKHQVYWAPFARIIRRTVFDSFTFDISSSITIGEDFIMNLRLAQNLRRVVLIPDIVYHYIWTPNSAMSKLSSLDKEYKKTYNIIFIQSISEENQRKLRGTLFYFYLQKYFRRLKRFMKERLSLLIL